MLLGFFCKYKSQINIFYIFLTDPSHIQTILAMSLTSWDTMKTRGMRRWIVNIPSMIIIKRKVFSLILDFWVPVCSLPWTAESVHFHIPTVSVIDFFFTGHYLIFLRFCKNKNVLNFLHSGVSACSWTMDGNEKHAVSVMKQIRLWIVITNNS